MKRILLAFFSIYSLMHAFIYSRVKVLLPPSVPLAAALVVFMAVMIFAPVGTRLLERTGRHRAALVSAFAGYCWLAFIFYCFCGFLLLDFVSALCGLLNFTALFHLPDLTGALPVVLVLATAVCINIYGFFEARAVRVERFSLKSAKLPAGTDKVRIAQISDVHLGIGAGEKRMARILRAVESEKPDILVSTGDLIDGPLLETEAVAALLSKLRPGLGMYAVTGNHEVFAGLDNALRTTKALGFTVLRGEVWRVGNILNIVGVDDPATGCDGEEGKVLENSRNGLFTLLLKHRPLPAAGSLGLFDLQLSGHTHYGQLFPFRYLVALAYPLQNGPYNLSRGSVLYTSRGSGSWGPPVRVFARPEVTLVEVSRENNAAPD